MLGLSLQTCESRSAILCGKENPKHFSSGVWNILHWIKTASPLRETKVHVNADHNYSCLTALAVEPVRQETFLYCFPSPPKHYSKCAIIEPCLCLLRLEIQKDSFASWTWNLVSYIQSKNIVLMTFEWTFTAVQTETHILELLFLCRASQRKQQVGLAWIPLHPV